MDLGLSGRVAIVAASSKGLGKASAFALAREGASVVLSGRTPGTLDAAAEALRSRGWAGEVLAVRADVTRAEDCERLARAAIERFGRVDILVNNSGGPAPGGFDSRSDEEWAKGSDSTLMNVVRLTRLVLPEMRARGWGRIVNITSLSARQPIDGLILSNVYRAGVHAMTRTLATEVAREGITVNCLCPGMHATDRLAELASHRARERGTSLEAEYERMAADIPMRRLGRPEEFADALVFLCSERASFITGTSLLVDGGACRAPA